MTNELHQSGDPHLPPQLEADLRRLYRPELPVPPSMDEEILARARSHFARRRRLRLVMGLSAPAAAAAGIAFVLWLGWPREDRRPLTAPAVAVIAPEDIDRNGRVDILDAFALARDIERSRPSGVDVNGDGHIDRADVDVVARSAVRLSRGALQ